MPQEDNSLLNEILEEVKKSNELLKGIKEAVEVDKGIQWEKYAFYFTIATVAFVGGYKNLGLPIEALIILFCVATFVIVYSDRERIRQAISLDYLRQNIIPMIVVALIAFALALIAFKKGLIHFS